MEETLSEVVGCIERGSRARGADGGDIKRGWKS